MALGANVRRLIAERAAQLQVERATRAGGDTFSNILAGMVQDNGQRLKDDLAEAGRWVTKVLGMVRSAPGGQQYADDDAAAADILKALAARKGAK